MARFYNLEVNGQREEIELTKAFCIGYAGRDKDKTYEHIQELAEIGIPEPKEVPIIYPVSMNTVTQENVIEVVGKKTSGEAEIIIIFGNTEKDMYITVGSDHTDRELEAVNIGKSKQVCGKPFGKKAWKLDDVLTHWDELILSSEQYLDGKWVPYQKYNLTAILHFEELIKFIEKIDGPKNNSIYFSGTVPLLNGFLYGDAFKMSFEDPVRNDAISSTYEIINIERG